MKAIFDEFGAKGIEIISVSLDTDKQKWLKAVNDDKMGWINISDLQGFAGKMARYYTLNYLPFNLVVDPNGKILYKNISFADLRTFLKDSPIFSSLPPKTYPTPIPYSEPAAAEP